MNKVLKIKVYSDPGHAWGAVKRKVIDELGLTNTITGYSYQKGGTVYLEEDCDLSNFVGTLRKVGIDFKYIEDIKLPKINLKLDTNAFNDEIKRLQAEIKDLVYPEEAVDIHGERID